jgi:hypothetical protein
MAFKVDVVQLGLTDTLIASMPANAEGSVHGLVICNNQATQRTFTLRLFDYSEGTTSLIVSNVVVAANSQFTWTKPINLQPDDILYGSGADIVVLASIYEGVSVPAAVGFTGRGAWSSIATYAPNDVVSYDNNSYLANATNTNSQPPSANWTLLAAQGTPGTLPGAIRTPTAIYPVTGGDTVPPTGPLTASAYAPLYSADLRNYREFQVALAANTSFSPLAFTVNVNADSTDISPALTVSTAYIWRCRDVALSGAISDWMTVQAFTTKGLSVVTPTITVEGGPSTVGRSPLVTGSAYQTTPDPSATHLSTNWEVRKTSDNSLVYSSYNDTVNLTSIRVPYNVLTVSTSYAFRAQYNSTVYGSSAYGSTTATTTSTFANAIYAPATVAVEDLYIATFNKCVSSISDDAFVMAYSEIPSTTSAATFNATLRLSVWNRVGGVFVESVANIVTAATDMAAEQNNTYDVEMLTPTLGIVVWRTYYEGTGSGFIYGRPFTVSGSVITLAASPTTLDTVTSTARQRFPKVTRLNDDLAVLSFWGSTSAFTPRGLGIRFVGTSLTLSATVTLTIANLDATSSVPVEIKRISNTSFICATQYNDVANTTYNVRMAAASVNASTAVITMGSTIIGFDAAGAPGTVCKLAVLTSTLAVFGARTTYNQIAISGTTLTAGTGGQITTSTENWNNANYDMVRISDTTALAFLQTTGRIITATATTVQGASQTLQSQNSTATTIARISDSAGVARFEQFSQNTQNTFNTMISLFAGGLTSPAITVLQVVPNNTEFTTLSRNSSTVNLSASRAVVMTRDASYASSATLGRPVLSIWNIEPNTPTFLARTLTNIVGPISAAGSQNTLCALTPTRILMTIADAIYLFSVSDAGFTQLATATIPASANNANSSTSVVRITDTTAIICYRNSSAGIGFVPVNLAGDTISLSTAVVVSSTVLASYVLAVPLSATRVLVTYIDSTALVYKASLVGFTTVWAPIQSDVTISGTTINQGPGSFVALDSTRALLGYQGSATTGNVRVVSAASDTITSGTDRATPTLTSSSSGQSVYALALDSTNGLVAVQESTGTALYSFTVGAGAATPSVLTKVADLNTNATQGNPCLRMVPIASISTGVSPTAAALTQERDSGTNQTFNVLLRRFLRGSP